MMIIRNKEQGTREGKMAKYFDCCGGIGRHLGNCERANQSKGTGLLRNRKPGDNQARLLANIKSGRLPRRPNRETVKTLAVMIERGWLERNPDGKFEVTKAGEAAWKLWKQDNPEAGKGTSSAQVPKNACYRCAGRKKIPGPKRTYIDCPACNGTGTR
jgi:hypothetical protein